MLETIRDAGADAKKQILENRNSNTDTISNLLPRRLEILQILKEHKVMNFNSIKRRFANINDRTLRYDLKKLIDGKLIIKLGSTRGVYYTSSVKDDNIIR